MAGALPTHLAFLPTLSPTLQVLSGLLASIPNRYSIDLWDLIRLMLSPIPKERPTIDEILAMPSVCGVSL